MGISARVKNDTCYIRSVSIDSYSKVPIFWIGLNIANNNVRASNINTSIIQHPTIEGISNQENAKTPDLSNANTVESVLNALKEQYPDLFNNAV